MQKFTIARSPLQSNGLLSLRNVGIIVHNILVEEKGKGKEKQIFEIKNTVIEGSHLEVSNQRLSASQPTFACELCSDRHGS